MKTIIVLIGLSVLLVLSLGLVDKLYNRRKSKREAKTRHRIRNSY